MWSTPSLSCTTLDPFGRRWQVCRQTHFTRPQTHFKIGARYANPEEAEVYFPGRNHGSLSVLWGPEEDGWNFGILIYGAKWDSREVMLIETGAGFMQTSIKAQLDASAMKFISSKAAKGEDAANYAISYSPEGVLKPTAKYKVGDPITVKIGFGAEVPKGDAPLVEGTLSILLETSEEKITAKVLKVLPAAQ